MSKLPKANQTVLAFFPNQDKMCMAQYVRGKGWKILKENWKYTRYIPNYWIELPIEVEKNV